MKPSISFLILHKYYVSILTCLCDYLRFLSAYNARFSIEQDLDIIQSSRVAVDGERVRYILSAVDSVEHSYPSNLGRKKRHNKPSKPASNKNTARHCPVEPRPMINGDLDEDHLQVCFLVGALRLGFVGNDVLESDKIYTSSLKIMKNEKSPISN